MLCDSMANDGTFALAKDAPPLILSVESSPEHNPGPVTIPDDLQVMSPKGSNTLGRTISQQDVRPEMNEAKAELASLRMEEFKILSQQEYALNLRLREEADGEREQLRSELRDAQV